MTDSAADLGHRRILIYGVTGTGKTTAAAKLSDRVGIPWHSIDDLTWETGWVSVPPDEQRRRINTVIGEDSWIIDHAYGGWLDLVIPRCDLVVALDYPRLVSLGRLIRRSVLNICLHRTTCNNNHETWRQLFSRDSIIRWHFASFARKRTRIRAWAAASPGPVIKHVTSPQELRRWLSGLESSKSQRRRPFFRGLDAD